MAKKKANKGTAKLKKIISAAKKVYNKSTNKKKWTTCVREASKKV